jgi:Type I phosphodiesterase / nucleotide pyrophosphatase
MSRRTRILWFSVLLALAWGAYAMRRAVIKRFFVDAPAGAAPDLTPDVGPKSEPTPYVRVVLLDGLSRDHAAELPNLARACRSGLDLIVDVGFPTVSLPVQHVLWTGLTQQQSGLEYRIARLDPPPPDGLPMRVPGSVAVAESHRELVHSFGFTATEPALDRDDIEPAGSTWRSSEFLPAARSAVAGPAPLAFVHILRIDEAGHAHGAASPEYAQASREADGMLAELIAADPAPGRTRWFVLADHGQRPGGGHADAEPEIRMVRACVFGDVEPEPADESAVHLIDVHRAIAGAVGLDPIAGSRGRSLAVARANPAPDATIPRAQPTAIIIAVLIAAVALVAAVRALGIAVWMAVLWPALSVGGIASVFGAITLSNPVVYPPWGRDALLGAAIGLIFLGVAIARLSRRMSGPRALAGLLLPAAGAWLASAVVCGVPQALAGGPPPLLPIVTACCSVLASILTGAFATAALVVLVTAWTQPAGRLTATRAVDP